VKRLALSCFLGLCLVLAATPAPAVTITIVNKDSAGQGLNDPTPATPVGGNPGTTIGQQRLNVFNEAARIWGQILPGDIEIRLDASFTPLDCSSDSAVLAQAGPTAVDADFPGAPVPGTWFVVAEANELAGEDRMPGESPIFAQFNSQLGQSGCFAGYPFYYGFDTNGPAESVNFLTVALHEFAHGFGFTSFADETTGKLCCGTQPLPDIFDAFVFDTTLGKSWNQMTVDADRKASAINTGNLVWSGPAANAAGAAYLSMPYLKVTAPSAIAGTMSVGTADFGAKLTQAGVSGSLVAAMDAADPNGPLTTDACSPLTNPSAVAGKIALADRGTCNFTQKASNVQAAGAIGLVVANSVSGPPPGLGGKDASITIPAVEVSKSDGATLRANLPAQVTIGLDPTVKSGMNASGLLLLYAPSPVEPGSSVSHWDTSAYPNLLMEPVINYDLPIGVDITTDALRDIGWFGSAGGAAPVANFTFFSKTPKAGDRVQFTDTSTGFPISWSWNFGDGGTSSDQNPAHTFGVGTWQVSLTASNANGSSTRTQSVVVSFTGPVACSPSTHNMCLVNGRYRVSSHWKNQYAGGATANLYAAPLTDSTGAFWMFTQSTYEYLIRVNTATDNGRAWISIPMFTDVEFWIDVFDTQDGQYKEYHSPPGNRTLIYDPYFFVYP
jgi:PKD repeat protein